MEKNENKARSGLGEILRFVITGGVCFLIEFVALVLLRDVCGLHTLVATPIAFLISVVVNYLLCVVWVFHTGKDSSAVVKVGFVVTSVIGLGLNELFMWLLGLLLGEETVLLTLFGFTVTMYMLNKAIATLLVMIWNFFTKRATLRSNWVQRLAGK